MRVRLSTRRSTPLSWLSAIALKESRQVLRKRARQREVSIEEGCGTIIWHQWNAADLPTNGVDRKDRQQQLQKALSRLPQPHRAIVELRYFEELSFAEVADRLAQSVSSAKMRHHSAKRLLSRWISGPAGRKKAA